MCQHLAKNPADAANINTNHNFQGTTNYKGQSSSSDADSHYDSQEIPCPERNMKVHYCVCCHNGDITECTARPRWLSRVSLLSFSTLRNIPGSHLRDICSKSSTWVIFIKRFSFRNRKKSHKKRDVGNRVGVKTASRITLNEERCGDDEPISGATPPVCRMQGIELLYPYYKACNFMVQDLP